jgi:hypothetical protein
MAAPAVGDSSISAPQAVTAAPPPTAIVVPAPPAIRRSRVDGKSARAAANSLSRGRGGLGGIEIEPQLDSHGRRNNHLIGAEADIGREGQHATGDADAGV